MGVTKIEKKKAPTLRFPEFTEDWEERKSKEIFKAKVRKGEPNLPVLSVTQTSGVVYRGEVGIDIKYDVSTLKNYKVIEPNDFVISLRSFQGGFELSDKLGITSPAYTIFVPKYPEEQNNLFWRIQFKRFQFIESLKTVTFGIRDGKSISFNEFGDLKIKFPSNILEQQKIGTFFKQLDDTIALHQRKLDLLKEQKKGYLQKMFPKNGAKVPELRFAGFADDWEERKSKEIFKAKVRKGEPNLPVLSVTQTSGVVYRGEVGIDIKYDVSTLKNYKVIEPNDFVISLRSFQGGFELSDKLGITSPAYTIFVPKYPEEQNNLFWRIQFKRFQFIESLKTVTFGIRDGKSISFNEFGDLKIKFPSNILEQQKIGTFFKQLDDTIALHQRKLDLLKEQKKGFLQKMFV
ncbi:restriction endonuclease subunit S [Enterococcus dongliensis]|uniref:restriction endonuclease subunit S n=1 Tax=Enterococcus dongliensis TaxID=2559925 RepID=UPI002890AC11|nr:restriction endonuclease subunit S [Enterococcus dongliensis]MDT2643594.1 restriction endonuclease subunit S [Enterococcus dongliensis]